MEAAMSDLLSGVSSYYDTYTKNNISADKMKDKLSSDYTSATDDEMMEVCKEFEAYFTEQVFKAMQKMVPESDDGSSSTSYVSMFKDTLTQEYASLASESDGGKGLGIAQMLYEQMKRNYSND
jgi:flagellar protein FlgJ